MVKKWIMFILSISMAFIINMSISKGLISPYAPGAVLFFTIIFVLLAAGILKYPWYSLALAGYVFAFTAYPYLYGEKSKYVKDFINWSIAYASGNGQINSYIVPLSIFMYAVISFTIYAFVVKLKTFYIAVVTGILIFAIQWYGFVDHAYTYMLYFIAVSLVYYAVIKCPDQVVDTGIIGWGLIASVVIMGAFHIMPVNVKPVSWQLLDQWVQDTFPIVRTWRGGDIAGPTSTGFSEGPQRLGGPAVADDRVAFYVKTTAETLYLRGAVYDTYDGKTWKNSYEKWTVNRDGTIPLTYGKNVRGRNISVEIMEGQLKTSVLFSALQPIYVKTPNGTFISDEDIQLRYNSQVTSGFKYTITFFQPIVDPKEMKTYKSLEVSSDMKKYLQLPEELPGRVKDLARQITDIYDSPFEKAMAIQTYLRRFSYDLNVPAAPSNRDFTDYFLFDLKRGYCTYYASAMTVMLRSIGIPARYVTGFVFQSTGDENTKEDYKPVTNASAHAWVEAYFPGYGWINFEPTPFYLPLYFEANYSSSSSPWVVGPNGMTDWYMNVYANNSFTPSTSVIDNNSEHNVKDNKTDIAANKKDFGRLKSKSEYNGKTNLKAMYIFIFLFFILIVSIVSSIIIKKKKLIAHMDPRERAIWQFEGILQALAKKGFVKRTGETVLEFADRVSKHLEYEINFRDVASAFNRIRYAKDLRSGDIEIVHKFYCMVKK